MLIGLTALVGCDKRFQSEVLSPVGEGPQPTFKWVAKNVFDTRCVICHNAAKPRAKVDLSSYEGLVASKGNKLNPIVAGDAEKSGVFIEMNEAKMPPEPKLFSADEIKALETWIAAGAPEKTPGVVLPPQGAPNPPQANYEWLSANSLRRCGSCHGIPFKVANVDFTSYATLMASTGKKLKPLTPGDPAHSAIYDEVLRGKMPPKRHGLTPDELKVVQQWINAGALNN